MIRTKFQELLGTKYPIIQAGMGPYSTFKLCSAAAKAGGVGIISTIGMGAGLSSATPEAATKVFGKGRPIDLIQDAIFKMIDELKDYPDAVFGVNCPVSNEFVTVALRLIKGTIKAWNESKDVQKKLKLFITSAGDPLPWAVNAKDKGSKTVRKAIQEEMPGIRWAHVIPAVDHAKRCERADVDLIIATGREGGAHCAWRDVSTIVLVPEVVKQVKKPVVAGGGISDGISLAAALAMGAVGIQMGTRMIATQESDFEPMWKQAIVKRTEQDTLVGRGLFGPMRFLRNPQSLKIVEETIKLEDGNLFKGIPVGSNEAIMRLEMDGLTKLFDGDEDNSIILGGSVTGRIHNIPTVKELFDSIMSEAEQIILKLPQTVIAPEIKAK
ncbi:MAG TPA: nitronate monooxygenase [Candidatus Deferrimicrobium sp.]|nr:nitronate monooxygenase [Candidatus Deferrimicrobium sp.]